MRELLEKAHQEEEKGDEIFAEDPEDVDFVEPVVQRDVFLDEFADTDDEVEDEDEEALEKRLRREERKVSFLQEDRTDTRPRRTRTRHSTL